VAKFECKSAYKSTGNREFDDDLGVVIWVMGHLIAPLNFTKAQSLSF
jgi:hypothetical protein